MFTRTANQLINAILGPEHTILQIGICLIISKVITFTSIEAAPFFFISLFHIFTGILTLNLRRASQVQ